MNLSLLTDFYELTMAGGYLKNGRENRTACFDMFFRKVPDRGGFGIMAGLEQLVDYLKENDRYLRNFMAQHFPKVWIAPLEGTYLSWIDFSSFGLDDKALADFMEQEAQLYLSHGINYGGSGFMRLNLACSRDVLAAALERLLAAAQRRGLV